MKDYEKILAWMYIVCTPVYMCYLMYGLSMMFRVMYRYGQRIVRPYPRLASFDRVDGQMLPWPDTNEPCPICMDPLDGNDANVIRLRRCRHVFHMECIKPWNHGYQQSCPLCRQDIGHIV